MQCVKYSPARAQRGEHHGQIDVQEDPAWPQIFPLSLVARAATPLTNVHAAETPWRAGSIAHCCFNRCRSTSHRNTWRCPSAVDSLPANGALPLALFSW